MRPIKLTMTAFGAYARTTVIDFDKLGTQGLYLITGDTGAGKTTIFDAISFALFGKLSGESRKPEMLRSRYADVKTDTVVELDFDYLGKRYKISRTLKSNNEKKVRLEFPDRRKPLEKKKEVNKEIEDLLGINASQFKRIVMLAQGDFRKLLFSDTGERQEIFRRIFDTGLYNRFEEKIAEKAKTLKNNFEDGKKEALYGVSSVKCDENGGLGELKQRISDSELPNLSTLDEFCTLLKAQNSEDGKQNQVLTEKIHEVKSKREKLRDEITKEDDKRRIFDKLKKFREQLPEFEKRAGDDKKSADEIESANSPKIDELKKQSTLLEDTLGEYKKREENVSELNKLTRQLDNESAKRDEIDDKRKRLSEKINTLKTESETLKNAGTNVEKLTAEIDKIKRRRIDITELLSAVAELEKKGRALDDAREKYRIAQEESAKLGENAKQLRRRFNDEQAGIIAEALIEGSPCPVCGSVHHPNKAVKSENAPTQAQVEEAEELARSANEAENSASSESGTAQGAYNEAKKAVIDSIEKQELNCGIENAKETADVELKKLQDVIEDTEKELNCEMEKINRSVELEKLIPKHETDLSELDARFNKLEKQISADKTAVDEKNKQIAEQKLKFESESAAKSEIADLNASAEKLEKEIRTAKGKAEQSEKDLHSRKTQINTLSEQLPEGYVPISTDEKTAELSALEDEEKTLLQTSNIIGRRLDSNTDILNLLLTGIPKLEKQEEEYNILLGLSNIANGKSGGKTKLETFVQMEFFRDILRNANVHFRRMSNEQYELVRKEVPGDNRSDHSLDLDIRDYYNGTVRDVKSLSGGESFIASLSLALGLSETVQQNTGGTKLDTMFVDEGFGSLDDETLQQAMKALTSLTDHRLIGIISHVDAVKRDISKKIIVKKDGANGSTAEVVV